MGRVIRLWVGKGDERWVHAMCIASVSRCLTSFPKTPIQNCMTLHPVSSTHPLIPIHCPLLQYLLVESSSPALNTKDFGNGPY